MLLGTTLGTTFRMMLGAMLAPLIPPSWGKRCKTHPRSSRGGGKAGSSQRGVRAQRALLEGGGQPTPGSAWLQLSPKIISPAAVFFAGLGNFIFIFRAVSWRGPTPGLCTAAVLGYSAPGAAELQFWAGFAAFTHFPTPDLSDPERLEMEHGAACSAL